MCNLKSVVCNGRMTLLTGTIRPGVVDMHSKAVHTLILFLTFFSVSGIKINCFRIKMNFGAVVFIILPALSVTKGKSVYMSLYRIA